MRLKPPVAAVVPVQVAEDRTLNILNNPTPFLFFTGKGGVGKTSSSCALAITMADAGKRVLLISTDPASNLDQVLNTEIGGQPTPVRDVSNFFAVNINPERAAKDYRSRIIDPYRGELPESLIAQMEEQLSGACTVEIAAFDEFTSFLVDESIVAHFDHIIFDTAPTGHTLRLLNLPAAWSGFLDDNLRGATCLGPASGMTQQHERYSATLAVLSDQTQTTLVLVSRAETIALEEAARSGKELYEQGIKNQHLIINGIFTATRKDDPIALAFERRNQRALDLMPDSLAELPRTQIDLQEHNIVGMDALRTLYQPVAEHITPKIATRTSPLTSDLLPFQELIEDLAKAGKGLIMVMGKGGVGKTTLAATVALELASRGHPVHLSTTDPAAHIQQVVGSEIEGLEVSRIDPKKEVEDYTQYVLRSKGKDLDAEGLALLEEDLRSPCTEEVAVFRAFSRTVSKARNGFVVLDTAPTGHTLLLLDTAGAYHREVERSVAGSDTHLTTPLMRLQDADFTKILIATLAESTPVSEAVKLQEDLGRADIKPYAWLINQSLAVTGTEDPILVQRSQSEIDLINEVHDRHANKTVVIPWLAESPTGPQGLKAIAQSGALHSTQGNPPGK